MVDSDVGAAQRVSSESSGQADIRLIDAVRSGDYALATKLLDEGADIHQRGEQDWVPLNFAAGRGDLQMVQLLVERGADVTLTGRDRRTPLMIAKAAGRIEVVKLLTDKEKALGIWKDTRQYCKAFYLRDLRKYGKWSEQRKNWKINKYWSDEMKADYEKQFEDSDVVFVHQDFTVTKSMWHGENVLFDAVGPEWTSFCENELKFKIPDDLL